MSLPLFLLLKLIRIIILLKKINIKI